MAGCLSAGYPRLRRANREPGMTYWKITVVALLAAGFVAPAAGQDKHELVDGKWVKVQAPQPGTPAGEVAAVRRLIDEGRNRKAVGRVEDLVEKWPVDEAAEEAMFLAGQAEINRGRLFQAYEWFEKHLSQFPAGQFSERALRREFAVAERFLAGEKRIVMGFLYLPAEDDGLEILARIAEHAPGSKLAEEAVLRIADHHYAKGQYAEAVESYDQFVQLFGKTAKAPYARLQAARAMYASYRGEKFDETPLLEAEQRFAVFARLHPDEAKKANVQGTLQNIRSQRVGRLFKTAAFYERVGKNKPAVFYYRQIASQYPDTAWAANAGKALARLGAAPVEPSTRPATQPADGEKEGEQ